MKFIIPDNLSHLRDKVLECANIELEGSGITPFVPAPPKNERLDENKVYEFQVAGIHNDQTQIQQIVDGLKIAYASG